MAKKKIEKLMPKIIVRVVICLGILIFGLLGMKLLAGIKKPPEEISSKEIALKVEVISAVAEDVPVYLTGYGEVKSLNSVSIAPEVSGKIIFVHVRLEPGEIIHKNDILFITDKRNYKVAVSRANATVMLWENTVLRFNKQLIADQSRLKTMTRNRDLAKKEYERIKGLYEQDDIGTSSGVDISERSFNTVRDQADQMAQAVEIYPIKIQEAKSNLASSMANLTLARINLERCTVRAPFNGRIKKVSLEPGQYVSPGIPVITLTDDSILEILVSLDSIDADKWLRFSKKKAGDNLSWFNALESVDCLIKWTENKNNSSWKGKLHRVVEFNRKTRTLTVAVRVNSDNAIHSKQKINGLPLAEGMFCSIIIPGKVMKNVYRLPRWAVSYDNTAFISNNGRLKTVSVKTKRRAGEEIFISKGIKPGDKIIITRLVEPLENSLLEIIPGKIRGENR